MRTWTSVECLPRHLTPIPEGARVNVRAVRKCAALLGRLPTFYQLAAAERIVARWPDGRPVFTTILISEPRQCGKTTGIMDCALHHILTQHDQKVWFTAQSGLAARDRFVTEIGEPADKRLAPLGLVSLRWAAGDIGLSVPATGSKLRPMPPTSKYLHGGQGDKIIIDEAWSFTPEQGDFLMQAIEPTMITRPNGQIIIMSAAGDIDSDWWHDMLAAAIAEPRPGVAVVDYGAPPSHDPAEAEAAPTIDDVLNSHPGLACGLTTRDKLLSPLETGRMSMSSWLRGYGNIRQRETIARTFDLEDIEKITTDLPLDPGPVALGVAVDWTGGTTALAAAGTINGTPAIEIIEARPGRAWLPDRLAHILAHNEITHIAGDSFGPAKKICDRLAEDYPEQWYSVATDTLIAETDELLRAITPAKNGDGRGLLIRRSAALTHEFDLAELRSVGEKGRLFSRKRSVNGTARIEAALCALAAQHQPQAEVYEPAIWSPQ